MKKILVLLVWTLVLFAPFVEAMERENLWKKVTEANQKGRPQTAIQELAPIIKSALQDKAYAEAVKAIGLKIALEGNIQGNKPEEKIIRLQAEIAQAPKAMQPVMTAILANWYWHYFKANRYRFLNRASTAAPPGPDFTTWDLPRILGEIDKQFTSALSHDQILKTTPIETYDALLEKGTETDSHRPTLFDFLVFNALEFYTTGEQAAVKAEDEFELAADSPVLGSAEEFLNWQPASTDTDSPTLKAVGLYQNLLAFHRNDEDQSAFLDADLWRLHFGFNKAVGEEKKTRYKSTLERFTEQNKAHPLAARALSQLAGLLNDEGEPLGAYKHAEQGFKKFPASIGGRMCFNIMQQIQAGTVRMETERVWCDPLPAIAVTYRNATRIYFRAIPYDFKEYLRAQTWYLRDLNEEELSRLLTARPALAWSADLPATPDFKERTEQLPAPKDLKPGFYFLLAGLDSAFQQNSSRIQLAPVWVSELALVMRAPTNGGLTEGFVLNAASGEPVPEAQVQPWVRNRNNGRFEPTNPVSTDANGLFRFSRREEACIFLAEQGGQSLATGHEYWTYGSHRTTGPDTRTVFFTDRALYRPGQAIQFKGICLRTDLEKNQYQIIKGQFLTVVFYDVNHQEIDRRQVKTNDYGSFSGSFTAPRERLTGSMRIEVMTGPGGNTWIRVEEYKRPKFQVELSPPTEAARLNQEISVPGKALAYTGAAVGQAQVKYRVVREVRLPDWCWWGRRFLSAHLGQGQAVAHGTTATAADGSFQVKFPAKPDPAVLAQDEPVFDFTVHADVTDPNGETRSEQISVQVGYTALQAALSADQWQTGDEPVALSIQTKTLDGKGRSSAGTIKLYSLKQPDRVKRPKLESGAPHPYRPPARKQSPRPQAGIDGADPDEWPLDQVVAERSFTTDGEGAGKLSLALQPGCYRAMLFTKDAFGKEVTARLPLHVLDVNAERLNVRIADSLAARKWSLAPGEKLTAVWGTGYEKGRAFVEIEQDGKLLRRFWTAPDHTQEIIEQNITEAMRGGITLRVTFVRENRAYLHEKMVDVPWSNKKLDVKWEHFTSKLAPGQKETWTAVITGPDSRKAAAEMAAGLYDASLDAFLPLQWPKGFNVFRREFSTMQSAFENRLQAFQQISSGPPLEQKDTRLTYRKFPAEIIDNFYGYQYAGALRKEGSLMMRAQMGVPAAPVPAPAEAKADKAAAEQEVQAESPPPAQPDLDKVSARKNLQETAFFFPHLLTDKSGMVKLEFTMPEALTQWRFMGFAHDGDLRSGFLSDTVVTSKDLMVEPNPPRFVREGDQLFFSVKISNQSDTRQTGRVKLTFAEARTLKSVDTDLANTALEQAFDLPAKASAGFTWPIHVPDGLDFLTYKVVAATEKLSDGEEGYLPVLSRRILVRESLPLPLRGQQTKQLEFSRLIRSGESPTLQHQNLVVQMASQPIWYAVMALPYLMEFPYECTEQTFNRFYANALARHTAASDPKIRKIFDLWKNTPALDSPLAKNQDLKAVLLEETPWKLQAISESEARKNIGSLFDHNRLEDEAARCLKKLADQQLSQGAWPWFPGGPPNDYITLYITTGFGRLRHLGLAVDMAAALKAISHLDHWITGIHQEIQKKGHPDDNHLTPAMALYIYCRSFFLDDQPLTGPARTAVDYFLDQAEKYWLKLDARLSQAHLAIGLQRFGRKATAMDIMQSIKERSVTSEELGRYWRDQEYAWWWFRAPIETQAMMIEAFDEVLQDEQAVQDCRVWLLKQKQAQDWKTTKATADAVYALLLRGTKLLSSDAVVDVALGGRSITPQKTEAGTGFYEKRFGPEEIKPDMGHVTLRKSDDGVAWGSIHWQYLEDIGKISSYEGTPLKLKKTIFVKDTTKKGQIIKPVDGPLAVGDELLVRLELRTDRDMEYIHLKDQRGSGTEPLNVLSHYKFQDGLAYYESTKDSAGHFFIDYLPKGTYVFEYGVRIQHKGRYQTGPAEIQCMYAPEFNSHSESFELLVK